MPIDSISSSANSCRGLWKITEDEQWLQHQAAPETASPTLSNPLKRLEFLAARVLLRELLKRWGLQYQGITKDAYGKPFLTGHRINMSLSHSYPYVAAIIHRGKTVGIDLEQPKDKLLRIAPRILSAEELANAGDNIIKHCVFWCAKETLVKIHGKKDLTFARNLLVSPFSLGEKGHLIGRILADNIETAIPLEYEVSKGFVMVWGEDGQEGG